MTWEAGMKVDPIAYASFGFYSESYGVGEEGNTANLFSSAGLIEDAPDLFPLFIIGSWMVYLIGIGAEYEH